MQKQAPSVGRILAMALFALSCFGLLLFLWIAFGGSTPLKPKAYRFTVPFKEAGQLAQEADVRISGVSVGKVKSIVADPTTGNSNVVVEMEPRYAPVPRDTRAMLRQKSLLGEIYVELTPGEPSAPKLADGGTLPPGNIEPTVELDEILRAFDPTTRAAFETWQQELAIAGAGRGQDLNDSIALLAPLAEQTTSLLTVLRGQQDELSTLVRDTGVVFASLSARDRQLAQLVENTNGVFETTAARNRQLADTFVALPTFQRETRATLTRLERFAQTTDPLITQLRPVARELTPTLNELSDLAPDLNALMRGLGPAISASSDGLPAVDRLLGDLPPFLAALDPVLTQLNPALQYVAAFPRELTAFMANSAVATNAQVELNHRPAKYLRVTNPISPMGLANYPRRVRSSRANPYHFPGAFDRLAAADIPVFSTWACVNGIEAPLAPGTASVLGQDLTDRINRYAFSGHADGKNVPAPGCTQQGPFTTGVGTSRYPRVGADATPPPLRFGAP
ncbi:MAG: MCE family protein [Solirubrobacteraceae bacterium]|nr:MCE family protein [Solirubrobacteraceae bacterium]